MKQLQITTDVLYEVSVWEMVGKDAITHSHKQIERACFEQVREMGKIFRVVLGNIIGERVIDCYNIVIFSQPCTMWAETLVRK